jgi:diguanylate cyclase (GGDEF)-like protein
MMGRRLTIRILLSIGAVFLFVTLILAFTFRQLAFNESKERALVISELVRDTLTSYMVMGIMDRRDEFLSRMREVPGVESIRVIRGESVIKQFGPGSLLETPQDDLEKKVLAEGKVVEFLEEGIEKATYKVVIPYKAVPTKGINCLKCHQAKEGEVLGAISLTMDLIAVRNRTFGIIFIIALAFLAMAVFVGGLLRNFFEPYLKLIAQVKSCTENARRGIFTHRIEAEVEDETKALAENINKTLDYFDKSLREIEDKVRAMIGYSVLKTGDILSDTSKMVDELLKIYKFKRVIEKDKTKQDVYKRLIDIFTEYMSLDKFSFYEVDSKGNRINPVWVEGMESWCNEVIYDNADECRAKRTGMPVDSREFICLCPNFIDNEACTSGSLRYYCIPVYVGGQVGNIFQVVYEADMEEFIELLIPYIKGYLNESAPVLEARTYMDLLKEQSIIDALTGLYNRRFLEDTINTITAQIKRRGTTLGILAIDVDYFKQVNDAYGHDAGDMVLVEVAKTIKASIRESDIAIRYGGEEFLALLMDVQPGYSVHVAEKIRKAVESKVIDIGTAQLKKTVSIGVSEFPVDTDKIWQCIKFADVALYRAKEEGRNRVVRFTADMWTKAEY